jgi:hypothetical protein
VYALTGYSYRIVRHAGSRNFVANIQYPHQLHFDSARVDWGEVGLDLVAAGTSLVGLNAVARAMKISRNTQTTALTVNMFVGGANLFDAFSEGDIGQALLTLGGFVPGPVGVGVSLFSLGSNIGKGFYSSP